ncbi:unnamed protein product [Spirodela intermedia]|uniref:Uncharacterized protein n=2 Tax=Spirodela intermedia TaxID=51605 RepID=A0A7I8IX12_SPIIN|nr:unnamed protein product [Spirodela intermedia]CAA6662361.1 unnamed protein product [Spirodela intermedia]CAA7398760.1 unnamed protein product [Spirodela intermedia]
MEFLKVKNLWRPHKSKAKNLDPEESMTPDTELKADNTNASPKAVVCDSAPDVEEDEDDDDLITNEIKRRLKELRRSNFMVLIPEESCPEEEETCSSEWRESEVEDGYPWCGFDALYGKYCERMLFFDKMSAQKLLNAGSQNVSSTSPKSAPKKLVSTIRSLSFKKKNELQEDGGQLQQQQDDEEDDYQNLETVYVAHVCLTWEALHCRYIQLKEKTSSQPVDPTFYSFATQEFQQFQVLLQRFIENEPFERGSRVEIYAQSRHAMPKLLQVPCLQGLEPKGYEQDDLEGSSTVLAADLMEAIEEAILTFRIFLKMDKKRSSGYLNLFGAHQCANSLHHVQNSLDKKEMKLKELIRRQKRAKKKKKQWPATEEEVELLFGLIDIRVVSRVLRMARLSKEHLLWCEEKMSKLQLSDQRLHRDPSPVLFPC